MNIFKALFGGESKPSEERIEDDNTQTETTTEAEEDAEREESEVGQFDVFKYDGVRAAKIGQYPYAVKCFNEALNIKEDLETRDHLAQAFIRIGELEAAMQQLQILHDAEPDNLAILLQMARLAYMLEDYALMSDLCSKAMAIDNNNVHVHYCFAQAYAGTGNLINTIAMLTKAIAIDEGFGDAYLLRGQTLLQMGDVANADSDAMWLLEKVADNEDVLMLKARIEHAKGDAKEAIEYYGRTLDANPFRAEAYRERGAVYYSEGDSKAAQADLQAALELEPEDIADVNGTFSANGIEQQVRQAYSNINPFGI